MKVLVVHNRYRSGAPSGENRVVDEEVAALAAGGVDVSTFFRSSDELAAMSMAQRARAALGPITGAPSAPAFRDALERHHPDVVHLHNPYPLISPSVINICGEAGIPVVATIHNFRLRCMNGLLFRDGQICTACEWARTPVAGIRHGCYRGSRAQSTVMAGAIMRHDRTWKQVSRFVAVSEFVADRLDSWGIPRDRIRIKPNPVPDPGQPPRLGSGFLFAGRLSEEKGIPLLIDAWARSGLDATSELWIAGDGPLRDLVAQRSRGFVGLRYVGLQTPSELSELRRQTAVQVMPSLWYEPHGAAAESFAFGRPVIATSVGALPGIVDGSVGWSVQPDQDALASALIEASDPRNLQQRSRASRERFESTYASEVVMQQLIEIYRSCAQQ